MEKIKPWNFCETPEEKCTMNYCDENGCQNRKRVLVSEGIPENPQQIQTLEAGKKEKTFEELTKPYRFYGANSLEELILEENVIKLLQQVREATIAECLEVAIPYFDGDQAPVGLICEEINDLPTDRIKTDL